MLWLKAFHVIFMVTWFAGLFYLPRLFVYHCEISDNDTSYMRFCTMERKLFVLMTIGMTGTIALGVWLWLGYWGLPGPHWLHLKLGLALGLVAYHFWLGTIARRFAQHANRRNGRFYRLINEIPAIFLIAMVILAIVKPL